MTTGRQRRRLTATVTDLDVAQQTALLVGVQLPGMADGWAEASLDELELLTATAGSQPVDAVLLRRDEPNPATFVGSGQLDELVAIAHAEDVDVVVFDNDLTPVQQRNLAKRLELDVVDRVAVILDIFAQHATSREGMLQVELALLEYHLPRLRGKGVQMSRLGGGVGTRFGGGETKLETDRRRILDRVARLRRDLKALAATRDTQAKARRRAEQPLVALVGYTNAGKSSLMNRLTDAGVLERDQLFSTLGSTTRRLRLPSGQEILLSDTVGFVQRLPHQLVEAFRSTLEEIAEADLLLHVVDASDPDVATRMQAVRQVLAQIPGATEIPELLVLNKADLADPVALRRLENLHPEAVTTSAATGMGIGTLAEAIAANLDRLTVEVDLMLPFDRGDLLASIHRNGRVIKEDVTPNGMRVVARLRPTLLHQYAEFTATAAGQ